MSTGFRAGTSNDGYLQINGTDILAVSSGVLGIKNTGAQSEMRLYCESSNAHYASLKAPPHSDFIGNVTFTLPGTAGSSGQVLQTDGSGNLSWVNQSGGGGGGGGVSDKMSEGNTEAEVVDTGSNGHFKVTTEGTERLRISSTGKITQTNFSGIGFQMSGSGDPTLQISDTDGTNQHVMLAHNGGDSYIVTRNNTSHGGFRVYSQNGSETLTRLRIDSTGRLLVGTTTEGHASAQTFTLAASGNTGITVRSGSTNQGSLYFSDATSGAGEYAGWVRYDHGDNNLTIGTNSGERIRIGSSGQIGIGGTNYGTTGQVLTSNGPNGSVSWTTISGGGGSYGNSDVDNHLNTGGASSGQILSWNGSDYAWVADQGGSGGGGGLSDLVDDTTPQLGGNLDLNSRDITGTGNIDITGNTTITSADSGNTAGPELSLYRNSSSAASADYIGQIKFQGKTSSGATSLYAKITGKIGDATNGSEDGIIEIAHRKNGSNNISARWNQDELQLINGTELSLDDDQKIKVGTGDDLQLYHVNGNSYISNTTGSLYIRGANGNHVRIQSPSGEDSVVAAANGSVELYYDDSKKLETTNAGVTVTGALTATSFVKSGGTSSQYLMADGSVSTGGGISNVVEDTTPQLGGNLDVQAREINTSTTNGNIKLAPNGTGVVEIRGAGGSDGTLQLNCSAQSHGIKLKSPPHSAAASYTLTFPNSIVANKFLTSDASGNLSFSSELTDLVIKQSGSAFTKQSQTVALFQRSSTTGHGAKIAIVGGNAASSDINFGDTDDEDAGLVQYLHTTNSFRFCTNGDITNEKLHITSDGKIGINNGAPLYAMHFKNAMASSPSFIHMEVTGSNAVGGGGGIAFDTSASNNASSNSLYLATIKGIRNSADDGSNDLVFSTTKAGVTGDDGNSHSPKEKLRIDSSGHIRAYGDAGSSSIADAKAAFATINAVVPSAGGTAALNVLSRGSGTQENIVLRSISTDGWAGAQFRAENYNFTIRTTNVLTVDFNGSAQFKGKNRPSGLDTRISQYGSLLVGTSGELISNARCAIDSGNGDIKTIGNGEFAINTSTYQTGINLHTSSNLSTLTVYSNNSSTHRSIVVYDNGQSANADKYRAVLYANGNILGRRLFLGGSTNGGFDYNAIADTLEFLTTNGGTHSELNATAYVPSTNGGKHLGHHNKRWDNVFCNGVRFGGNNTAATTLDDYEEGTFTATCANSVTLYSNADTCQYVRVGNLVTVMGQVRVDHDQMLSNFIINNLPFTVHNAAEASGLSTGSVRLYGVNMLSSIKYAICVADAGSSNLEFQGVRNNTSSIAILANSGAYYMFNITYKTS